MQKVVCPACGLVNLEKFVTYPHCAACGALLTAASAPRIAVWRRPISSLLWATGLGLCCAALGVAGILTARETQQTEEKRLVVYVQSPRRLSVGQTSKLQLGFDDLEMGTGPGAAFEELQLRLPRALLQDFTLVAVSPMPQNQIQRRNGIYFYFGSLTRDQPLFISLRPRRAGLYNIALSLYARDFLPSQWNGILRVEPLPPFSRPGRAESLATRQTGP